jgi:hypothetical protein
MGAGVSCCSSTAAGVDDRPPPADDSTALAWQPQLWFVAFHAGKIQALRVPPGFGLDDAPDGFDSDSGVQYRPDASGSSPSTGRSHLYESGSSSRSTAPALRVDLENRHDYDNASEYTSDGRRTDEPSRPSRGLREAAAVLRARLSSGINGAIDQFTPLPEHPDLVAISLAKVRYWWQHVGLSERRLRAQRRDRNTTTVRSRDPTQNWTPVTRPLEGTVGGSASGASADLYLQHGSIDRAAGPTTAFAAVGTSSPGAPSAQPCDRGGVAGSQTAVGQGRLRSHPTGATGDPAAPERRGSRTRPSRRRTRRRAPLTFDTLELHLRLSQHIVDGEEDP